MCVYRNIFPKIAVALQFLVFSAVSVKSQVVTINEELGDLLKIDRAIALAPAEEKIVGMMEGGIPVHGAFFDSSNAFTLEPKYLGKAFESARIEEWSFRGRAAWTGGKRSEFVILNRFGQPLFYFYLLDTQPNLVEFRQVGKIDSNIVSFDESNFFLCQIDSKDLASTIREAVEGQPKKKFVPEKSSPKIKYYGSEKNGSAPK